MSVSLPLNSIPLSELGQHAKEKGEYYDAATKHWMPVGTMNSISRRTFSVFSRRVDSQIESCLKKSFENMKKHRIYVEEDVKLRKFIDRDRPQYRELQKLMPVKNQKVKVRPDRCCGFF